MNLRLCRSGTHSGGERSQSIAGARPGCAWRVQPETMWPCRAEAPRSEGELHARVGAVQSQSLRFSQAARKTPPQTLTPVAPTMRNLQHWRMGSGCLSAQPPLNTRSKPHVITSRHTMMCARTRALAHARVIVHDVHVSTHLGQRRVLHAGQAQHSAAFCFPSFVMRPGLLVPEKLSPSTTNTQQKSQLAVMSLLVVRVSTHLGQHRVLLHAGLAQRSVLLLKRGDAFQSFRQVPACAVGRGAAAAAAAQGGQSEPRQACGQGTRGAVLVVWPEWDVHGIFG